MPPYHIPERSSIARWDTGQSLRATDPMGHWEMPNQDYRWLDAVHQHQTRTAPRWRRSCRSTKPKFCRGHQWRWLTSLDGYKLNEAWAVGKEYQLRIDPGSAGRPYAGGAGVRLSIWRHWESTAGSVLLRWVSRQVRNDVAPAGCHIQTVEWLNSRRHVGYAVPFRSTFTYRLPERKC